MDFHKLYNFWFGSGSLDDAKYVGERMKLWFGKDDKVDAQLRAEFAPWLDQLPSAEIESWKSSPKGLVSSVLLLDQIPRNCFRSSARAFAYDADAREIVHKALAEKYDQILHPIEAVFLLLPLEHSEKLVDQEESVRRYKALHARAPQALQAVTANTADYARRHYEIVARFGRFPHRNQILGRVSTAEEQEFLKQPGSSF